MPCPGSWRCSMDARVLQTTTEIGSLIKHISGTLVLVSSWCSSSFLCDPCTLWPLARLCFYYDPKWDRLSIPSVPTEISMVVSVRADPQKPYRMSLYVAGTMRCLRSSRELRISLAERKCCRSCFLLIPDSILRIFYSPCRQGLEE